MGYWPYTLEKSQVTWMLPGATSANYEIFGGTFLADRAQPCINLGGAVRVSNRLLVPSDMVGFNGGENIDGFFGYMLSKTPIGKRADTDDANYWTIIIDSANYAGPVMMVANWFWDSRLNWHPQSKSWSHPDAKMGYIARGFEGGISVSSSDSEVDSSGSGGKWAWMNQWGLPKDERDDGRTTSTIFTGHSQYEEPAESSSTNWWARPFERHSFALLGYVTHSNGAVAPGSATCWSPSSPAPLRPAQPLRISSPPPQQRASRHNATTRPPAWTRRWVWAIRAATSSTPASVRRPRRRPQRRTASRAARRGTRWMIPRWTAAVTPASR